MKTYYLKATGNVCYNAKRITFPPNTKPVPIDDLAVIFFGQKNIDWQPQSGWPNQPKVLVFKSEEKQADLFEIVINKFYRGFIVLEKDWK